MSKSVTQENNNEVCFVQQIKPTSRVPNYSNSQIYKLCCKDPTITDVYVGSTTNFIQRKKGHKSICNNENSRSYNYYVYRFIREHGGFDNWDMIEVESYDAKNKKDLERRERYWIDNLKSSLNKCVPTRTVKEWNEDNKERCVQYIKEYNEKNKETIVSTAKIYYENNKEKVKEYKKEWDEKNKNKFVLHVCDICGSTYQRVGKPAHERTNKHKNAIITKTLTIV